MLEQLLQFLGILIVTVIAIITIISFFEEKDKSATRSEGSFAFK